MVTILLEPESPTNYRGWWNNPWNVVEESGQPQAGSWTEKDEERLRALVKLAHARGLWIRFYTLDGATSLELSCYGWFGSYSFGSLESMKARWRAAYRAGVDHIVTDQHEQSAGFLKTAGAPLIIHVGRTGYQDSRSGRNSEKRSS